MKNPQRTTCSTVTRLKVFPLRSGTDKDVCLRPFYSTECQMFYPMQLLKNKKTRHPNWKEKAKLSLFAEDMIIYVENSK